MKDFIEKISTKNNITKKEAKKFIESFIESIEETINEKGEIKFLGFGSFKKVNKKKRSGVNPKTLEKIEIPAKKIMQFKTSKKFNENIK